MPDEIAPVFDALFAAIYSEGDCSKTPIVILNRSFGQLRRQHDGVFVALAKWLGRKTTCNLAKQFGVYWAWLEWCNAAKLLAWGDLASHAFGADKKGQRKSQGFTVVEDAALLAEHRVQNEGLRSGEAEISVLLLRGELCDELSVRDIQRQRALLRSLGITPPELAKHAGLIPHKYSKS